MSVTIETTNVPTAPMSSEPILLGQKSRMPEFSLAGKVVLVSGAGRGLGLTQAEALLEAGTKVYALDRLEDPVCRTPNIFKALNKTNKRYTRPPNSSRSSSARKNSAPSCTTVASTYVTQSF
jgi:glutamate dehydrogenase/leucine dehydrogenase